ncbi:hypothetical protein LSAT2_026104 [Lamellibrachia satsuma]|nr:hypothetical protein LSAT2_026104 [Lamellibrachia satsuma]
MKAILSELRYAYIGAKLMENMRPSNSVDVSADKALIYQLARVFTMLKTVVTLLLLGSCVSWTDAGACGQDRVPYDEETEVCCAGAIHEKETGWVCCGKHWMSTDQDKCIHGRMRVPSIKTKSK